ncbi:MAG: hypothetical protein BMS9Abin29_0944 [Gemmatimonadota bacterium]|nr:MAG: hypothetical protein BMS9Abin29_0944 [Gemmatimonadota bacterium]
MTRAFHAAALLLLAALIAMCPSTARAQAGVFGPSSQRPPMTVLPSCATGHLVGACFDFESGTLDGWSLAEWAAESSGYVSGTLRSVSGHGARSGRALRVQAEFRSGGWSAIALDLRADVSLADYAGMVAEVLAPADTTLDLAVRFVFVSGPYWDWLEMEEAAPLEPGEWSVVEAPLDADAWRGPRYSGNADERRWAAYLSDVHRIIIRIEANTDRSSRGTMDLAMISVDNIRFPVHSGR